MHIYCSELLNIAIVETRDYVLYIGFNNKKANDNVFVKYIICIAFIHFNTISALFSVYVNAHLMYSLVCLVFPI